MLAEGSPRGRSGRANQGPQCRNHSANSTYIHKKKKKNLRGPAAVKGGDDGQEHNISSTGNRGGCIFAEKRRTRSSVLGNRERGEVGESKACKQKNYLYKGGR